MYIGVAILTDNKVHNISRNITFNISKKYNTSIEAALLPQHISLKQSFPYNGDIGIIEEYIKEFCLDLKPFKIVLEKIEVNLLDDKNILTWLNVKESKYLRDIHRLLCIGLEEKFNIKPLGFDGEQWQFHSTLTCSEINEDFINELVSEYNNKEINMDFDATQIVMFCCIGDCTKISEYFSLKIFNIGKQE